MSERSATFASRLGCCSSGILCAFVAPAEGRDSGPAAVDERHEPVRNEARAPELAVAEMNRFDEREAHMHHEMSQSSMQSVLGIARSRMGSGTSWLPDSSPMYSGMTSAARWGFMFHGNVFAGQDWFSSDRGSQRFISVNSVMAMAWHPLASGEFMARVMLSVEPAAVGKRGYPLILQTGETANGEPLHDRQHPHDLFMELAVLYSLPISDGLALQLYVAPAGEPALGPTAYPHRISSISDPFAPIGHHWQDSTHIAFGVLTFGVFTRQLKLEGSWFNGREPDEDRWDLDLRAPDSYSVRLTWNPSESWSLQGSYGYLPSPEPDHTSISLQRTTTSASYNARTGMEGNWASTFVFGLNVESEGPATPSFLLETNWNLDGHHVLYGRAEYVRKTGHDLVLGEELDTTAFDLGAVGLGYVYYLGPVAALSPGIGVRGTLGLVEGALDGAYGTQFPLGGMLFLQLRPAAMAM
jgi:hypothetical protein